MEFEYLGKAKVRSIWVMVGIFWWDGPWTFALHPGNNAFIGTHGSHVGG